MERTLIKKENKMTQEEYQKQTMKMVRKSLALDKPTEVDLFDATMACTALGKKRRQSVSVERIMMMYAISQVLGTEETYENLSKLTIIG